MNPPPLPPAVAPSPGLDPAARVPNRPVIRIALGAIAIVAGLVLLYARNPVAEPGETSYYPSCPFHRLTGLYCPGCGATRALHHLLHGRVAAAFDLNPLLIVSLPWILYVMFVSAARTIRPGSFPRRRPISLRGIWTIVVVAVTFAVLRNLPYRPVAWMAP